MPAPAYAEHYVYRLVNSYRAGKSLPMVRQESLVKEEVVKNRY